MAKRVNQRLVFVDGIKSFSLEEYPESAWTYLSGAPGGELGVPDYYGSIPWLRRGVDLRAGGVSSVPFAVMRGDEDVDSTDDWQNTVGFMPDPKRLFWLIEASLTLAGRAYLFREVKGVKTKGMRYILPTGVTPKLDPIKGLTSWERRVGEKTVTFPPEAFVYFWPADPYTEIGPSDNSPAKAALMSAAVLANVDTFVASFFGRGGVKATVLTVSGTTQEQERKKLKEWWESFMSGVRNSWKAEVVNADTVKPIIVGEGLESLQNKELTREKREDIATALGIPQTMLFSDASTNATAQEDTLNFLKRTVIQETEFIAEVLNEQVFTKLGLHCEFRPETLDEFQEDESSRATSLKNLVDATMPLPVALRVLGYELDDEDWALIDEQEAEPEPEPMPIVMPPSPEPDVEETPPPVEELRTWERFALRRLGKEGRPFVSKFIPLEQGERIASALAVATTEAEIKAVFSEELKSLPLKVVPDNGRTHDIRRLTEALLVASKALQAEPVDPVPQPAPNITVNVAPPEVTVNMAEMKAEFQMPPMNVTNEVQPAPVIVEVSPTPIEVTNDITLAGKLKGTKVVKRGKDKLIQSVEETMEFKP